MLKQRLERFRRELSGKNFDAALLYGDHNRNYITGFTGDESYALITKDKAYFITDSRYTEQATQEAPLFEVVKYTPPIAKFLGEFIKNLNIKNLGFEEDILSYKTYNDFSKEISCELLPLNGIVEELRIIKEEEEINLIKKAASIATEALHQIKFMIKPGVKESDIALELEYLMKKKGASGTSFSTIVASGARSSLPHGTASDKLIEDGDFVTIDFGCIYKGYCSDMTRTFVVGKATEKMIDVYDTVLKAQVMALEGFKDGASCKMVDKIARDYITEKGYGEFFGHGLGHSLGREVHEMPRVSKASEDIMRKGTLLTDEPGIYLPGEFGVRIEDLVLVTEQGCEILSTFPKELISL